MRDNKAKNKAKQGFRATKNLEAIEASRFFLVRGTGLEPVTPCTSSGRVKRETTTFATKLHHAVF